MARPGVLDTMRATALEESVYLLVCKPRHLLFDRGKRKVGRLQSLDEPKAAAMNVEINSAPPLGKRRRKQALCGVETDGTLRGGCRGCELADGVSFLTHTPAPAGTLSAESLQRW